MEHPNTQSGALIVYIFYPLHNSIVLACLLVYLKMYHISLLYLVLWAVLWYFQKIKQSCKDKTCHDASKCSQFEYKLCSWMFNTRDHLMLNGVRIMNMIQVKTWLYLFRHQVTNIIYQHMEQNCSTAILSVTEQSRAWLKFKIDIDI